MAEHTKLELGLVTDGDGNMLHDRGYITVGDGEYDIYIDVPNGRELARRIVACVNACAGISTEALEHLAKHAAHDAARLTNLSATAALEAKLCVEVQS